MTNFDRNSAKLVVLDQPFPIYRKYPNGQSYFKIVSPTEFIELKLEAKGFKTYTFQATILPDRVYIQDLILNENQYWSSSDADEFEGILSKIIA